MRSFDKHARRWRPLDRVERRLPRPAAQLLAWVRSDEFLLTAASLAFFALISLAPAIIILLWITGAIVGDEMIRQMGARVAESAPNQLIAEDVIGRMVEVSTSAGWTAIAAALWPATAYGAGLARALDRLTPQSDSRTEAIRGRALSTVLIAGLPLLVLAALLLLLFGPRIIADRPLILLVGLIGAVAVALAVMTGFLALVYGLFSPKEVGARSCLRGGAVAALIIVAVSLAYVGFLRFGADFEERYASSAVAAVVVLALWLYLANGALITGYKVALRRSEQHGRRREQAQAG